MERFSVARKKSVMGSEAHVTSAWEKEVGTKDFGFCQLENRGREQLSLSPVETPAVPIIKATGDTNLQEKQRLDPSAKDFGQEHGLGLSTRKWVQQTGHDLGMRKWQRQGCGEETEARFRSEPILSQRLLKRIA
jgi:hypothetical protein